MDSVVKLAYLCDESVSLVFVFFVTLASVTLEMYLLLVVLIPFANAGLIKSPQKCAFMNMLGQYKLI